MPKLKANTVLPSIADNHQIKAGMAADADNPEFSSAGFTKAMPASELFTPDRMQALVGMKRPTGRPKSETPKVFTAIRLDADVLAEFKATGKGWQTRMNAALRQFIVEHPLQS
jgi:uncharacterized protein (DUF4415 family)